MFLVVNAKSRGLLAWDLGDMHRRRKAVFAATLECGIALVGDKPSDTCDGHAPLWVFGSTHAGW